MEVSDQCTAPDLMDTGLMVTRTEWTLRGDSEIAAPTEIVEPRAIVRPDRKARPAHAAFGRLPRARTAAGV